MFSFLVDIISYILSNKFANSGLGFRSNIIFFVILASQPMVMDDTFCVRTIGFVFVRILIKKQIPCKY